MHLSRYLAPTADRTAQARPSFHHSSSAHVASAPLQSSSNFPYVLTFARSTSAGISIHLFPARFPLRSPLGYPGSFLPPWAPRRPPRLPCTSRALLFLFEISRHLKSLAIPTNTCRRLTKYLFPDRAVSGPTQESHVPSALPTPPPARSETAIERAENEIVPPDRRPGFAWDLRPSRPDASVRRRPPTLLSQRAQSPCLRCRDPRKQPDARMCSASVTSRTRVASGLGASTRFSLAACFFLYSLRPCILLSLGKSETDVAPSDSLSDAGVSSFHEMHTLESILALVSRSYRSGGIPPYE